MDWRINLDWKKRVRKNVVGDTMLEIHRKNYDSTGAGRKRLQPLWWEFPPAHWDELREGCNMGFLSEPQNTLHPNSEMDDNQRRVAGEFVDELVAVGAVRKTTPREKLWTNAPLFSVPKPGQPGQWCIIPDCKAGGQNEHIGGDPVYLNHPL